VIGSLTRRINDLKKIETKNYAQRKERLFKSDELLHEV
jgi:hypothetical protein